MDTKSKGKGKAEPKAAAKAAPPPEDLFPEGAETEEPEDAGQALADNTSEAASMADLAGTGGGSFDGDLVTMENIEGKKHMFLDFKIMPSTFREGGTYACMSLMGQKKKAVCNSNAMVILKGLAAVNKAKLPQPNAFVKRTGKKAGAKPYWDFASAEELKKLPWMP